MVSLIEVDQTRVCTGPCGLRKRLNEFNKCSDSKIGIQQPCKICRRARDKIRSQTPQVKKRIKAYRVRNKKRIAEAQRKRHLRTVYGITAEEFEAMIVLQKNICPFCCELFSTEHSLRPAIHHDHMTGFVIDLLHHKCNRIEGLIGTAVRAERAAKYMRKNEPMLFKK